MRLLLSKRDSATLYLDEREGGERVVLKVLHDPHPSPSALARFFNELEVSRSLTIGGVRRAFGRERVDDRHALRLEYIEGKELSSFVVSDRVQLLEFLDVAAQIARTLGELHEAGIVHRDVKSSNILLTPELRPILIDFGLASTLDRREAHLGHPTSLEGTLAYLSPEQTGRMHRVVDERTDLYSLGVTLYEVVTGKLPFTSTDPMELVHSHLARRPTPPHEVASFVPSALSGVILKLLEKNPDDRYRSAFGLEADLRELRRRLLRDGVVAHLALGAKDIPRRFAVPERLLGRQAEVETLLHTFSRACGDRVEFFGIRGGSGVGKSALVGEVQVAIAAKRARFVRGKHDQLARSTPYSALAQAFNELVSTILTEDPGTVDAWRLAIAEAVGDAGRALFPLLPNLQWLIGDAPPVPELIGEAAVVRLRYLLRRLLHVVATAEHPLVLFIDDLQWADAATLDLLEAILTDPSSRHVLVIGAWRDNEVQAGHPLAGWLTSVEDQGAAVRILTLPPLTEDDVRSMIAAAMHTSPSGIAPLAKEVFRRTGGNAFFVRQLLERLAHQKVISIASTTQTWTWDHAALAAIPASDNVVELLAGTLGELEPASLELLQLCACLGNRFDLHTVQTVAELGPSAVAQRLRPLIERGLLCPQGDAFRWVAAAEELQKPVHAEYTFAHDKIQQAAYQTLTAAPRGELHLRIGRHLWAEPDDRAREARLFEVAHHLNLAADAMHDEGERVELASINLRAMHKALLASAYGQAEALANAGLERLGSNPWNAHYDLTLGLSSGLATIAAAGNDLARTEQVAREVIAHAREPLHKVEAYVALCTATSANRDLVHALDIGREALAELGFRFPRKPIPPHIVAALVRAKIALRGRIDELADAAPLTDARLDAALSIMVKLVPLAFRAGKNLFPLLVFELVTQSARHGNSAHAVFGYASYAIALCAVLKDYESGHRFGTLAKRLGMTYPEAGHGFIFENFLRHWREPLGPSVDNLLRVYRRAMELGDVFTGTWSASYRILNMYYTGTSLALVAEELREYTDVLRWDEGADSTRRLMEVVLANLTTDVERPALIAADQYDEASAEARVERSGDATEIGHFQLFSLQLAVFFMDVEEGLLRAERVERHVDALTPMTFLPLMHFYGALGRLRAVRAGLGGRSARAKATASAKLLRTWSHGAPTNYAHRSALVDAELARTAHDLPLARTHLDRAIALAAQHDAPSPDRALIWRYAAELQREQGVPMVADMFDERARRAFASWGAISLVTLDREPPDSRDPTASRARTRSSSSRSTTSSGGAEALDLRTVLKAAGAISAELHTDRLLERMLRIMSENAGAERATLYLVQPSGGLHLAASLEAETFSMSLHGDRGLRGGVPAMVNYVARTQQALVIADALADPKWAAIGGVREGGVRSVLCLPVLYQARMRGVVYLENNLTGGAFSSERLEVLAILASQAATSIENAQLVENLEAKVAERTRELETQRARIVEEKAKSDELLLNILPVEVARELKERGVAPVRRYAKATILFSDIVGFTGIAEQLTAEALVAELDACFRGFDAIMAKYQIEKIKTIGDAYMCAGGLPEPAHGSPADVVRAALEMHAFIDARAVTAQCPFRLRIGVHTGQVVAGVVGSRKFAYDIWGDAVNTASRMESSGEPGRVNVSEETWAQLEGRFVGTFRGKIFAKGKGEIGMYFIDGEREE